MRMDRAAAEDQLAAEVITLLRLVPAIKAAAARERGRPGGGHDRSAMLLLFPLMQSPQRAGGLAELCHADPSTVSRQVAELVDRGLVRRQADPTDGRASLLAITTAGREVCEQLRAQRRRLLTAAVQDWTDEDLAALAGLLGRFTAALAAAYGPPASRPTSTAHPPDIDQDIA